MNDFQRLRQAQSAIDAGDEELAWPELVWIFYSIELEPEGFLAVAMRLGVDAEHYKRDLLEKSKLARDFFYGERPCPEDSHGVHLELVK